MAHRKTLTEAQTLLLQWIADGCPPGVVTGDSYKISAAALARRDLIKIKAKGANWRAEVTAAGRDYLEVAKRPDAPPSRQGNVSVTEELMSQVQAAGGRLVLRRGPRPGGVDYAKRAMAAIRYGKVPPGKRLLTRSTWDEVELRLVDDDSGSQPASIPVPTRLTKPHQVIAATRSAAKGVKVGTDGRLDIGRTEGILQLQVSRDLLPRALRIGQAIFAEAERRGYEIRPVGTSYNHAAGVGIAVSGFTYAFKISELTDRVPLSEAEIARWRKENEYRFRWRLDDEEPEPPATKPRANGRLQLGLEYPYGSGRHSNWSEGPRVGLLDDRLPAFFRELADRAAEDAEHAERLRREQEERERERQRELERRRQAEIEKARAERLTAEANAWHEAAAVRAYLAALAERLDHLEPAERRRVAEWYGWASRWVDRFDPARNTARIVGLDDDPGTVDPY